MRFATRTFLWSFLPVAALFTITFFGLQHRMQTSIRNEVRSTFRQTQKLVANAETRGELQDSRFLRLAGDHASLKAGMQLLQTENESAEARRTLEDQLREMAGNLDFDLLVASNAQGKPVSGVIRQGRLLQSLDTARLLLPQRGFLMHSGVAYLVTSVAVEQAGETLGTLAVGDRFDLTGLAVPAFLLHNGRVVRTSELEPPAPRLQVELARCPAQGDCEFKVEGTTYLSFPFDTGRSENGFVLRSLQNLDAAMAPLQATLRNGFALAGLGVVLAAFLLSFVSARTIAKPLAAVMSRLRESASSGHPARFPDEISSVFEIRQLAANFNRAAEAVDRSQNALYNAYLEFVESLANALDARDPYTAGHSQRVSDGACAVAEALGISGTLLEQIRIGALLHDIGKIGIPDSVLQKPGRLDKDEFRLIQQHPTIGRKILEGVNGFQAYLPIVELHHENWDGTGYPHGLRGAAVPLSARIVHVVDAWDAMTSDRPYRRGMTPTEAARVLRDCACRDFDKHIVDTFLGLHAPATLNDQLARLSALESTITPEEKLV